MNRRNFLKSLTLLAGSLSMTSFLQACGLLPGDSSSSIPANTLSASPTTPAVTPGITNTPDDHTPGTRESGPSQTPEPEYAHIALVRTSDRRSGIRKAVELLGLDPAVGKDVLLKPNFNSADLPPGSTHMDTLHTMLAILIEMEASSITVAERSGMGHTRTVMQQKGIFRLAEQFDAAIVVLDELPDEAYSIINPEGSHWPQGFPVPNLLLDSNCVIQTCNLKTHQYGGHFTMALKNSVGFVAKNYRGHNYMADLHSSPDQRRMIAEINTAYRPSLIVLDGVQAFINGGPHTGTVANTQLILAGTDPVAIDAIGVAALRLAGTTPEVSSGAVFEQEQIKRAAELGLGVDSPSRIKILTSDDESASHADLLLELLHAA